MTDDGPWLNVPQAVVLEVTRDIERALNLSAETTDLLIIKANRVLARRTVIPLEADANKEQQLDALRKFREAKTAMPAGSHYLEAQQRVHGRLVAGVRTKARRASGGRYKSVDRVEYTGAELQGSDAIDKRTRIVMLFDLRINAFDYIESLTGNPVRPAGTASSRAPGQMPERSSQKVDKWGHAGDPVQTHRLGAVTVGRGHPTAAQLPGAAANIPGTIRPGARNKREDNARSAQATGFSRGATWGRPDASTLALYLGTTWDTFPIPKYFHGSFPKYIEPIIPRRYLDNRGRSMTKDPAVSPLALGFFIHE